MCRRSFEKSNFQNVFFAKKKDTQKNVADKNNH